MNKLKELLFLISIKGIGKTAIYKRYFDDLKKAEGIEHIKEVVKQKDAHISEEELRIAEGKAEELYSGITLDQSIKAVTVFDELYPKKLDVMGMKKPLVLYIKGDERILSEQNVAIIGTRKPTEWTEKVERRLVKKITEISDRVVVSGLALGCDKIAHEVVVEEKKKTIAVLPSGVNVITPASHINLADMILETGGCIVSEYLPDALAFKTTYIERDSIVAALSDVVIAVECEEKSGTMHTVKAAKEYNTLLGCYYNDKMGKRYSGNLYMVKMLGAEKIMDTDDLERIFNETPPRVNNEDNHQITIDEFLNPPS